MGAGRAFPPRLGRRPKGALPTPTESTSKRRCGATVGHHDVATHFFDLSTPI